MSAKRFTLIECNGNIEDGYTQSVYDGGEDVFELLYLLNELYEENNEEELDYFKSKCGSLEEKLFYINRENEQLKQQNTELKLDNDIKFWKHQFMMSYNASQIIMHEISRAIDDGYEVSEEFQKYLNELKVQNNENKEKMERLGI